MIVYSAIIPLLTFGSFHVVISMQVRIRYLWFPTAPVSLFFYQFVQIGLNPLEPKGSISGPLEINLHKS